MSRLLPNRAPRASTRPSLPVSLALASCLLVALAAHVQGQGVAKDNGHAAIGSSTVFANWNFDAGSGIPDDLAVE